MIQILKWLRSTKTVVLMLVLASAVGCASAATVSDASAVAVNPTVSMAALARAQAKFSRAMNVVSQLQRLAVAEGLAGDGWRAEILGSLMKTSEDNYAAIGAAPSIADAAFAASNFAAATTSQTQAVSPKSLGSTQYDLVYVPITPCRVLDTRAGGAPVPANTVKTYTLFSATNVGAASCAVSSQIPNYNSAGVAAFAANVTVDETGITGFLSGSFLEIYPAGGSTTTSFLNFSPNEIVANAGVVTVNAGGGRFSITASAPSQVIVDTYGVFIEPATTALSCTNEVQSVTLPAGNQSYNFFAPTCSGNSTAVSAICFNGQNNAVILGSSGLNGSGASCAFSNTSSNAVTVTVGAVCCSILGR